MKIDEDLAQEMADRVRDMAGSGASVEDMLRYIQHRVGTARVTFEAISVFHMVFDLPLHEIKYLGNWIGFASGNPGLTSEDLEKTYGARLRASLRVKPR